MPESRADVIFWQRSQISQRIVVHAETRRGGKMVSAAKRLSPATCLEPRRGLAGRGLSARAIISAPPRLRVNPFHFTLRDLCASARIPFALSPEDTANQNGPLARKSTRLNSRH